MPQPHDMQAFWWFIEGRIAGMGRPGFNRCHWSDLSLEESLVLSWIGKQTEATPSLAHLWRYLDAYGPKVAQFYNLSGRSIHDYLTPLRDRATLLRVLEALSQKTQTYLDIKWVDKRPYPQLHLTRNPQRLYDEVELLQQHRITTLISLIEHPLDHEVLADHFTVHHLPIEDVSPPAHDQVYQLATCLHAAVSAGEAVAVHCLAGLGRTTTMLMAAHLVQGYTLPDLTTWVRQRNPHFLFLGSQATFIYELAEHLQTGRLSPIPSATR